MHPELTPSHSTSGIIVPIIAAKDTHEIKKNLDETTQDYEKIKSATSEDFTEKEAETLIKDAEKIKNLTFRCAIREALHHHRKGSFTYDVGKKIHGVKKALYRISNGKICIQDGTTHFNKDPGQANAGYFVVRVGIESFMGPVIGTLKFIFQTGCLLSPFSPKGKFGSYPRLQEKFSLCKEKIKHLKMMNKEEKLRLKNDLLQGLAEVSLSLLADLLVGSAIISAPVSAFFAGSLPILIAIAMAGKVICAKKLGHHNNKILADLLVNGTLATVSRATGGAVIFGITLGAEKIAAAAQRTNYSLYHSEHTFHLVGAIREVNETTVDTSHKFKHALKSLKKII